jgi:hypothetical protein
VGRSVEYSSTPPFEGYVINITRNLYGYLKAASPLCEYPSKIIIEHFPTQNDGVYSYGNSMVGGRFIRKHWIKRFYRYYRAAVHAK